MKEDGAEVKKGTDSFKIEGERCVGGVGKGHLNVLQLNGLFHVKDKFSILIGEG